MNELLYDKCKYYIVLRIMNYLEIIYKFNLVISLIFEGDIFWDFIEYLLYFINFIILVYLFWGFIFFL